jgi:hypothetical protein
MQRRMCQRAKAYTRLKWATLDQCHGTTAGNAIFHHVYGCVRDTRGEVRMIFQKVKKHFSVDLSTFKFQFFGLILPTNVLPSYFFLFKLCYRVTVLKACETTVTINSHFKPEYRFKVQTLGLRAPLTLHSAGRPQPARDMSPGVFNTKKSTERSLTHVITTPHPFCSQF